MAGNVSLQGIGALFPILCSYPSPIPMMAIHACRLSCCFDSILDSYMTLLTIPCFSSYTLARLAHASAAVATDISPAPQTLIG
jgi:hypothetical protein